MATQQTRLVEGQGGLRGQVRPPAPPAAAGTSTQVEVILDSGQRLLVPLGLLSARPDGSFFLPLGPESIAQFALPGNASAPDAASRRADEVVAPVAEEELHVQTRPQDTGRVVVEVTPQVRTEAVDLPLMQEHVEVERVPVNRLVEQPPAVHQEGDVTIVPILEEVLVVQKKLMLREEVRITRQRSTQQHHEDVPLRFEEVHITRAEIPPTAP